MFALPTGEPEENAPDPNSPRRLNRETEQQQRGPAADAADFDLHLLALGALRGIGVHALRALVDATGGDLSRVWQEDTPTVGDWLARARVKEARHVATDIAARRGDLLGQARR
jgi:hypothetical protein